MCKELGYGITDTWDELVGASEEIAPTTLQGVNQRVTDFSTIVEQETTIMYVMIEREARMAREAWGLSMDASNNACLDVMSLRTTLVAQHAMILDLQAADRRRQGAIKELLAVDHKRHPQLNKALRSTPVITTPAKETTTSITNAQLQAMIDTAAQAAHDANRNADDSHTSGTGRHVQVARECTYPDFLKCQPLNFKGTKGVVRLTYSQRFQDLALMCDRMFPEEINKVERYVDGLPDTIHGNADNKRKSDDTTWNNHQQPNKRQKTRRAYAARKGDKRAYKGPRPRCTKCNYHHDGPCAPKCHKCNRFGHLSRDYRNPLIVNTGANQRGNICFECGAQGHFKRESPKLNNNNNRGNQVGNAKAQANVLQ
nr:hypothetical protein [Tanacetum cinerariifolium]